MKVLGTENPGDALTKHLSGPELRGHIDRMHVELREGRAETAPQLTTQVVKDLDEMCTAVRHERDLILQSRLEGTEWPVPAACPVRHVES